MKHPKNDVSVVINVYGGNNQYIPNATESNQTVFIYSDDDSLKEFFKSQKQVVNVMNDDAFRLRKYCDTDESWKRYLEEIRTCKSATDLSKVIVLMEQSEDSLLKDDTTKQRFLEIVKSLAVSIEKGNTIGNIRQRVYDAQQRVKMKRK